MPILQSACCRVRKLWALVLQHGAPCELVPQKEEEWGPLSPWILPVWTKLLSHKQRGICLAKIWTLNAAAGSVYTLFLKKGNRLSIVDSTAMLSTCKEGQKVWDDLLLANYFQNNSLHFDVQNKGLKDFDVLWKLYFTDCKQTFFSDPPCWGAVPRYPGWGQTFTLSLLAVAWVLCVALLIRLRGGHTCRVLTHWAWWWCAMCSSSIFQKGTGEDGGVLISALVFLALVHSDGCNICSSLGSYFTNYADLLLKEE